MDSDIAIARISPMIKQDPMAARGGLMPPQRVLPEVADKAEGILGKEIEDRQMRNGWWRCQSFLGASSQEEAAAWILKNLQALRNRVRLFRITGNGVIGLRWMNPQKKHL